MGLFRKIKAEFSSEESKVAPDDLLKIALREPAKPEYVYAKDYVVTIKELHDKGFCWNEIADWFKTKGVPYSQGSLRRAHRIIYGGEDLGY